MTPTWGEIGLIFWRLAASNEQTALNAGRPEMARAFAMAEALNQLVGQLSPDQLVLMQGVIERELGKQLPANLIEELRKDV